MNLLWLLVIVLIIIAFTGLPSVGYWNHGYGYAPSGIGLLLVIILVVLLLSGRL
jgi:hypothetical protein